MTLLSNHRLNTYKSTAARARRDFSPKNYPTIDPKKHRNVSPIAKSTTVPLTQVHLTQIPLTQVPSAPPATMKTLTIYVWNQEYNVEIPTYFDIYEGLRVWYPDLYRRVIEEERLNRIMEEEMNFNDYDEEEAWDYYEYCEYISDF